MTRGRRRPPAPPGPRHAAPAAAGLLGPRGPRASCRRLPCALRSGAPSRAARSARGGANETTGDRGRREGPRPSTRCRGPGSGEGAFRPLGFFLPRWLGRPRYRELPPRCPNTSAAAVSPPLIGPQTRDVTGPAPAPPPAPFGTQTHTRGPGEAACCRGGGEGRARVAPRGPEPPPHVARWPVGLCWCGTACVFSPCSACSCRICKMGAFLCTRRTQGDT